MRDEDDRRGHLKQCQDGYPSSSASRIASVVADDEEPDPGKRYAELVLALKGHLGGARGWQARVAHVLGAHPTYISKIARGERLGVGLAQIEHAISRGVPREAFHMTTPFQADFLDQLLKVGEFRRVEMNRTQGEFWAAAARIVARLATLPPEQQAKGFRDLARFIQGAPELEAAQEVLNSDDDARAMHWGRLLATMVLSIADMIRETHDLS